MLRHVVVWSVGLCGTSCSSVSYDADVAELVARVDGGRLRRHIEALHRIGPRPVSDPDATRATVEYLAGELRPLGYDVREETFEHTSRFELYAKVRPVADPDAETSEIPVAPDLVAGGTHAVKAQSERLGREGWTVESYVTRAREAPQVHTVPNLIATRAGAHAPGEVVELSAHYDTVAYGPGANDNGSGVAALLEVARVLATTRTAKTVRLCFFGAEEIGLRGSRAHVEALATREGERVVALINLDSVGFTASGPGSQREPEGVPWYLSFPDDADFLVVLGHSSSAWLGNLFEAAAAAYAPGLSYYSANRIGSHFRDAWRSDHASYWRAGLPAICISDTGEFRGGHYHTPSDVPETLDYAFLELVTRATAAATLHLAGWTRDAAGR